MSSGVDAAPATRPAMVAGVLHGAAAVAATWLASAVLVLVVGGHRLLASAPLTLVAAAFGGHVDYRGPLLDNPGTSTVTAWPLTLTAVAVGVLWRWPAGWRRTAGGRRAQGSAVGPTGPGLVASAATVLTVTGLAAVAAVLGRHSGTVLDGAPLHYVASPAWSVAGAVVVGVVVQLLLHARAALDGRVGRGLGAAARELRWPAGAFGAVALVLTGYAAGANDLSRLGLLLAALPNVAVGVVLLAAGVPLVVHTSSATLLSAVPFVGTVATFDGRSSAGVTIGGLLAGRPWVFLGPVLLAAALLVAGTRLAVHAPDRGAGRRRASLFVGTATLGAVLAAVFTGVSVAAPGGGPGALTGDIRFALPATAALTIAWSALGALGGLAAVQRLGSRAAEPPLRRLLGIGSPAIPPPVAAPPPVAVRPPFAPPPSAPPAVPPPPARR